MTNGDWIRSFGNKNLAAFLSEITHYAVIRGYKLEHDKDREYWKETKAKSLNDFTKWVNEERGERTTA